MYGRPDGDVVYVMGGVVMSIVVVQLALSQSIALFGLSRCRRTRATWWFIFKP
jgi:hypothetical protein